MYYLGVDPGKSKVGLAVVNQHLEFIAGLIVEKNNFTKEIKRLEQSYEFKKVILGDGTYCDCLITILKKMSFEYIIIDESNSTLIAKEEYWENNPPSGLKKLLPISLQSPPRAIDDYAAFVIAKRYLKD